MPTSSARPAVRGGLCESGDRAECMQVVPGDVFALACTGSALCRAEQTPAGEAMIGSMCDWRVTANACVLATGW
jgi:hypothetical protein